jgi:hypothetical protein
MDSSENNLVENGFPLSAVVAKVVPTPTENGFLLEVVSVGFSNLPRFTPSLLGG